MSFLAAFGFLVGLLSGGLSIYEFAKSRQRPGAVFAIIGIGLLVGAFFLGNVPSLFENKGSSTSFTPPSSNQQTVTDSSTTQVQQTPQSTPSPTPRPGPGTVLCQADASHGWSGWNGTPDWKVLNGVLISNGTYNITEGPPTIVAPCPLGGTTNYAVEATIQVLRNSYPTCFGIDVRGTPAASGWQGYVGSVYVACNNGNSLLAFNIDNMNNTYLTSAPFSPGTGYHTYRVEAQDNQLRFLIDGAQILTVTDNTYTSGGQVGLWSFDAQLNVSSFKVIAL